MQRKRDGSGWAYLWRIRDWIYERVRSRGADYRVRLAAEENAYADCVDIHELPEIYHYWSNRYLRPKLEAFGFSNPTEFFQIYLERQCRRDTTVPNVFVSIGSGNCDTEVSLCRYLLDAGLTNSTIECVDLNAAMLVRGSQLAQQQGVERNITFTHCDFNRWRPTQRYDAVLANQSLHHVLELETLLSSVQGCLTGDGVFLISDMIGRNGHMRWPEALAIVQEFWRQLPPDYRYNRQLKRHELRYENWDCSKEGFEGIRAQEILPRLVDLFQFELFLAFANVVDVFIDRGFGYHFDPDREWDRQLIDRVHERDEYEMEQGHIKPTHLIAVARTAWSGELKHNAPFTPGFCVRHL